MLLNQVKSYSSYCGKLGMLRGAAFDQRDLTEVASSFCRPYRFRNYRNPRASELGADNCAHRSSQPGWTNWVNQPGNQSTVDFILYVIDDRNFSRRDRLLKIIVNSVVKGNFPRVFSDLALDWLLLFGK